VFLLFPSWEDIPSHLGEGLRVKNACLPISSRIPDAGEIIDFFERDACETVKLDGRVEVLECWLLIPCDIYYTWIEPEGEITTTAALAA
jgi:hypothetical protein